MSKGQLEGKRALVTGGSTGIGREIAICFAKEGADVAIFGISQEHAGPILEDLDKNKLHKNQRFVSKVVDVSDYALVMESLSGLLEIWGGVDILVNNAGITRDGLLMKMKEEDWDAVLDVNLKSVFNLCQGLVRPMSKARYGKIINISSVIGLTGNAGQVNYAASKSGIIGFTKSLAQELAKRGVCANCIAPGFIQTRMTDALTDDQKAAIKNQIPMGRIGDPREIAQVALFLASDQSSYITGQVLTVDGGMVM